MNDAFAIKSYCLIVRLLEFDLIFYIFGRFLVKLYFSKVGIGMWFTKHQVQGLDHTTAKLFLIVKYV